MAISHATWFITSKCNLACDYCFTRFDDRFPQEDSSKDVGLAIVDLLLMCSTDEHVGLGFFGGEPLLQFNVMQDVVEYAENEAKRARKAFNYSVTTNATLLDKEKLRWLKQNRVHPLISIDGMPRPQNRRRYHDGSHSADVALNGAVLALEVGFNPTIRWSLHPDLIPFMADDLKILVRMGFNTIALEAVYEADWTNEVLAAYEEQMRDIARFYISELRRGNRLTIKPIDDGFANFTMEKKQTSRCGTATHGIGVDPKGDIYPCHRYVTRMGPVIGNVFHGWNEDALKQAQDWNVFKVRSELGECRNCPVNLRCPGSGCLCVNLDMTGDMYVAPANYCNIQRINQRVANDVVFILYADGNEILKSKLKQPDLRT